MHAEKYTIRDSANACITDRIAELEHTRKIYNRAGIILLVSKFRMVFLTLRRERGTSGCSLNFRLTGGE